MRLLVVAVIAALFAACAEKEFDPADPAGSFAIAREPFDDGNHEIALTKLGEFRARFPYSKFAAEAELLIADSHFELDQYPEAAAAYQQFAKLHPKHPKVDYALFRVGESYWQDSPEEIDREQEFTIKAIDEWRRLIEQQPQSPFVAKAKELSAIGERRLAESIDFIASFYCKLDIYHACAYRFIELADRFGQYPDLRKKALTKAADAMDRIAEAKEKDPESDKNLYHKRMSVAEIRERAANFRRLLAEVK
jgi:outer membrane protein assembly factor BamD